MNQAPLFISGLRDGKLLLRVGANGPNVAELENACRELAEFKDSYVKQNPNPPKALASLD